VQPQVAQARVCIEPRHAGAAMSNSRNGLGLDSDM
jgi:hypothetical protein